MKYNYVLYYSLYLTSPYCAFSSSVSFEYAQLNPNEHNKARLSTKNSTGHNYTSYGSRDSRDSRDSPTRGRVSPTKGYKENGNQFGSSEKTLKQVNSLSGRSIYDIETKDSNETPTKKVGYSNKNTVVVKPDFSTVLGKISITYRENTKQKFYNLFSGGLRIACDIAVDYTSSNLDPSLENSLHTLKLENNHYAKAIKSCGNILKDYDDDQQFPDTITAAFEYPGVRIDSNRAHRAGPPLHVRPPFDVVTEFREFLPRRRGYPAFEVEPPRMVRMRC